MTPKADDPAQAAVLYFGKVMHARLKPVQHRFTYRVMSLLIDLDRLASADRQSWLFGVNRRAAVSFHERDHGPRDGTSLRAHATRLAAEQGVDLAGGHVALLCYPRIFGYTFNPLSVYFCHDNTGRLVMVIYEVRNTFGDIHSYPLPVAGGADPACIRQNQPKAFYVSPFIEMGMEYHFRIAAPGEAVKVRILETDASGPLLAATFAGTRRPLTGLQLMSSLARLPFMTLKIISAIHWEALRLWIKGARLVPRERAEAGSGDVRSPAAPDSGDIARKSFAGS